MLPDLCFFHFIRNCIFYEMKMLRRDRIVTGKLSAGRFSALYGRCTQIRAGIYSEVAYGEIITDESADL